MQKLYGVKVSFFTIMVSLAASAQSHASMPCAEHSNSGYVDAAYTNPSPSLDKLYKGFLSPSFEYRPETWFHLNGKNISQAGLTADLEAIDNAGMQGIHLFNKKGPAYPNAPQVSILSPEWERMIGHVADEMERLDLNLTMQNCPGWSMAGGPWVPVEEAQREIVEHMFYFSSDDEYISAKLDIKSEYLTTDRNYQDIKVLAFPTPKNEQASALVPDAYKTNNPHVPWETVVDASKRVIYDDRVKQTKEPFKSYQEKKIGKIDGEPTWVIFEFNQATTLRAVELPPIRTLITNRLIPKVEIRIVVEALDDTGKFVEVTRLDVPTSHWYDRDYATTLSIPETRSRQFRLSFLDDPLFLSYLNLNGQLRLHNHEAKASKSSRSLQADVLQSADKDDIIDPSSIKDISEFLDKNGYLNWKAPKGQWTVIRLGHVNMLKTNRPAEPEATGWETSKLDKVAIENHLRNGMMGNLMRKGGPLDGHDLHGMLIDSWESHVPTWTMEKDGLLQEFRQRRGYDMTPYLPVSMGFVVESIETSNKFLRDLRQTMDDLYVEHFFEHFRTVSHDMGAKVYTEGASGEVLPGDPLRYYGVSDFPMTEFWYPKAPSNKKEAKPIFAAASATHLYDKPFLAAEAATQLNTRWNETPATIQNLINENFAKGINQLVFHTFSHSPHMDLVPGSSFGGSIGFPLLRTQTWWRHMPAWIDGLSRAQYLLRQGEFVADVLWYLGDELERHPFDTHPFPEAYKFDFLNEEILLSKVSASENAIHVKGAGDYRIIMLRDSQNMLLSTAKKIKDLVMQGAVVLGNKPINSPSLMDDAANLAELKEIADALWGDSEKGSQQVGKGRVYWGHALQEVLDKESIEKDVSYSPSIKLNWLHRRSELADIYFVSNPSDQRLNASVGFRNAAWGAEGLSTRHPEIWKPESGTRFSTQIWHQEGDISYVALSLEPHSSQFVIFNRDVSLTKAVTDSFGAGSISKSSPNRQAFASISYQGHTIFSSQKNWWSSPSSSNNKDAKKASTKGTIKGKQVVDKGLKNAQHASIYFSESGWEANTSGAYQVSIAGKDKTLQIDLSPQPIKQGWKLMFEPGWDTPDSINLDSLIALDESDNPAIAHYSGSVTYTREFKLSKLASSSEYWLDLGEVYNIAELWLNGNKVDTRFAKPYRFKVGKHVKQGTNQLKIIVTNTWRNQLIFDNQRAPDNKKTWTTNPPNKEDKILDKSGLVGPVILTTKSVH